MFPNPVPAWMKVSLSVDIGLEIADHGMTVGASRDSFAERRLVSMGDIKRFRVDN